MMSTTGLRPVIGAPTSLPVKPGLEIGVSIARSLPNSSTSPDRTLKGVPASATSSPSTQTRESRRISSAMALRMASPKVSSLNVVWAVAWVAVSGIELLLHLVDGRIRRGNGEFHRGVHLRFDFGLNLLQLRGIGELQLDEPIAEDLDGIALGGPALLFLLGAIVFAIDVADVVAAIPVGVAEHKGRACTRPRALHESSGQGVHRAHVLSIHAFSGDAESGRASEDVAGGRLRVVGIFVIHIVFAGVDHAELPELGDVHDFIEDALPERAFAQQADANSAVANLLGRKCRARGNARTAADDGIGAKISRGRIGNVHGSALAAAVAGLFAEQFGKHAIGLRALGEAMTMAAMRAGDVVIGPQRFADSHGDGLFTFVKVGEAGHKRAKVEIVGVLLELDRKSTRLNSSHT